MEKRYGAKERDDQLMQIGRQKWELIYGYGTDGNMGWNWRKRYTRKPTMDEIKTDITEQINRNVDEKILCGMTYKGMAVWLSTENQLNYKAAHDLAVQTGGKTLPVRFKFGTEEDEPQYYTFESVEELDEFYVAMVKHIQTALNEGWTEKDNIDWDKFKT